MPYDEYNKCYGTGIIENLKSKNRPNTTLRF